jgi:hypothetical protein
MKKIPVRPKLKVGGGGFLVPMYASNVYLKKILLQFWLFYECLKVLRIANFFSEHSVCGQ